MIRKVYLVFVLGLLIYILLPGPSSISNFASLPDSYKSTLPGDTYQVPNVAAYFSDNFRQVVVTFYSKDYNKLTWIPFSPLRLNYPPEVSFDVIKKHTDSTYLEELVYPLRDSIYINGFEPYLENGEPRYWGAAKFADGGRVSFTKTTIRFYPSSFPVRLIVWAGIASSLYLLYVLGKRIILDG